MARKLKVFRTAIGFDDAYVAAPSRKAALAAWGADADLFARGIAEEVSDARLAKAPLARPGEVIRVSRGDLAEHLKALPKKARRKVAAEPPAKPRKAKPPPTRTRVEAAEKAFDAVVKQQRTDEAKLERELDNLRTKHKQERAQLERKRAAARKTYREALDRWTDQA